MANKVARVRLYLTADGSRVVEESDPAAASLLVAAGLEVSDADIKKYGIEQYVEDAPPKRDAAAEHAAQHPPSDAPVQSEAEDEGEKALRPRPNKVETPPENKAKDKPKSE